jgi:hypothetical protein
MTFEEWYKGYDPSFYLTSMYDDLKETYEAGWNACADLNDSFTYDEVMSHLQEENTDEMP